MALLRLRPIVRYNEQNDAIKSFLQTFKQQSSEGGLDRLSLNDYDDPKLALQQPKYLDALQKIANRQESHLYVNLDDVWAWEQAEFGIADGSAPGGLAQAGPNLTHSIEANTARYTELFCRAVDALVPTPEEALSFKDDVIDIVIAQRQRRNDKMAEEADAAGNRADPAELFPAELTRRYSLSFVPRAGAKAVSVRDIGSKEVGKMVLLRGMATRVSDVKAAVVVNAYSCEQCGFEIFQPVNGKTFMPLDACPSEECAKSGAVNTLFHSTRGSRFVPFQEVRVQETSDQVPVGHIPRSVTVHLRGGLVRTVGPGDVIDIGGVFLPIPYTGFAAVKAGLLTDTYVEAHHVRQHKQPYEAVSFSETMLSRMTELQSSGQLYDVLARSIAPEIFGHLDVKKALLLQLIGGVSKEMGDGMKIRGDINVCLVGDPGVAKSQLLKFITKVAPRGVYTTGRGSSGVGLTAAVMRDPVTDEMVLEGGALVLADRGTCCIDEFDKMADSDRTAIHEVMEQQTISVAKAGITTTLNARTSILAAANPLMGRYDRRLTVAENVNLPPALLSRFDVLFLLLDKPERNADEELARHVTRVHMGSGPGSSWGGAGPVDEVETFSPNEIREWVARARSYRPVIPGSVAEYCVGAYVRMRASHKRAEVVAANSGAASNANAAPTPRALLAVLRLSQALARLRFAAEVVLDDVDEALRIVAVGLSSIGDEQAERGDRTAASRVYTLIRSFADDEVGMAGVYDGGLDVARLRERVLARGFTEEEFRSTLDEYEELNVWQVGTDGRSLVFVDA